MIEHAVVQRPVDPFAHAIALTQSALAALRRGDRVRGERLLRAALRLDPGLGLAWLWLGALKQGARRSICLRWARMSIPGAELPHLSELQPAHSTARLRARRPLALAAGGMAAALLLTGGFQLTYAERVYPGVAAFGQPLQGLRASQVRLELEDSLESWARTPLLVRIGEASWSLPLSSLGHFDAEALAQRAYAYGRDGSLASRLIEQGSALIGPGTTSIAPPLDNQRLSQLLSDLARLVDRPAVPARFTRDVAGWRIEPAQEGLVLNRARARELLRAAWNEHGWSERPLPLVVELPLEPSTAALAASDLEPSLAQLRWQTAQPLDISWPGGSRSLDRAALLDLDSPPVPGQPFAADQTALADLLEQLQAELDVEPQPSRLVREGNYAREFLLGRPGQRLDVELASRRLEEALERGEHGVALPLQTLEPPPGEAEALGLVALIGEGSSQFAGYSSADRDQNVLIGGQEFDGLLVPPGASISADETIGSITWEKGYRWGDMISGGELRPALGGGVCQVSTTLFRAAFWSGLEIIERHNHQWRLPWYEVDAPVGMDATIALGGPDLKIRNNTEHYLLIKVETDLEQKTQRFILYGTPPGWQVEMFGPEQSAGAIVIGRRVSKDGQVIREDRFTSYYSQ